MRVIAISGTLPEAIVVKPPALAALARVPCTCLRNYPRATLILTDDYSIKSYELPHLV